jgi:hypothetical protein
MVEAGQCADQTLIDLRLLNFVGDAIRLRPAQSGLTETR